MKWLHVIVKNLLRNKRRTLLTMAAVVLALFIFTMLQTIITALEFRLSSGNSETRLGLIERYGGPRTQLPESYWRQLERFDHVTAATPTGYTIVSVGWAESYYVAILVDPESYRQVFSGMARSIPASEYQHFLQNRNGVLVGQKIMEEYGWQVGDAVKLRSLQHKVELNLVISGVLKKSGGQLQQQETQMLINWNYYEMLIGNPGKVNIFWLRVDRPENAMSVSRAVTDYYRMGPMEVSVESESSMMARLASYTATIQLIIQVISTVVLFTILMVTVNTIALSMRERRREIAVMKALGYTQQNVLFLIVGESVLSALIAGLLGTLAAYGLFNLEGATLSIGLTFDFVVTPAIVSLGVFISLLLGLISGFIPAWNASRVNVIQALHSL